MKRDDNGREFDTSYSHEIMETIKITVVLDGDLAATINNLIMDAAMRDTLKDLIFCGHTVPKLHALQDLIQKKLDIKNRPEE